MGLSKRRSLPSLDWIFLAILLVGASLLFFRLDHRPFWQDEAETACLARNILHYGVPQAFDGTNLISQEEGREFGDDHLWRWSPWLQIYVAAAAFRIGGLTTAVGRFPFALFAVACIILVYLTVRRNFKDLAWARLSAALLTFSVPFLLFSRQCRYYSLGALLALSSIYAFQRDHSKYSSDVILIILLWLLFHTNYLLFLSFVPPAFLAGLLIYPNKFSARRIWRLGFGLGLMILPAIFLFRFQKEASMIDFLKFIGNLEKYFGDLFQFLIPLPVVIYLIWRWRWIRSTRHNLPAGEKFVLFLFLIIIGNAILLIPVPQGEHRYLVHLYPLCALILGWLICQTWRYHQFSGALLALVLLFSNWLYLVPMNWLWIINRPHHSIQMLTYPNIPLALYLTELCSDCQDVNQRLIQFFQTRARVGDTILVTYGDLPLQFYTPFQIVGALQGPLPANTNPDWVVKHCRTQWNRKYELHQAEAFIKTNVITSKNYKAVAVTDEEEIYGNIPDPYEHRFLLPEEPAGLLTIYRRVSNNWP